MTRRLRRLEPLAPAVLHIWAGEAAALIEEVDLTKQDYLEDDPDQELPDTFWDTFTDDE